MGYLKTSDTYLLTVDSDCAGRYDFSLTGDAQEATLNVRSISGKLVKSAVLNAGGNILISDLDLYTGDYLVEIDSRNDVRIENNTRYTLTVARNESFELISATDSAEVDHAEQGEKLLFALEVPESGIYDVTELQGAGLTVWFQETDADGRLGASKLRPEWVELEWDVPGYMTVCNSTSAWGDAIIGLDSEKHKFVLSAAPALDV
ncbi:MAG: T9SS type A sorting domain-containing protein [Lentisphaeria bacterium]|nr:T9SS type A sorting domain-containing protein [Lentisphaeria bacterium]